MNDNSEYRPSTRSTGVVVVGVILLVAAILLGLTGLHLALDDPCSGVTGCEPLIDTRPIGWVLAVSAPLIGLAGAWMAHRGSRPPSD